MDAIHEAHSPSEAESIAEQVRRARALNHQAMQRHQEEIDRMTAESMSPWKAVMIGCVLGAVLFGAGFMIGGLM
ncbi:hypothetical protein [Sphingomonas sp. NFX23]|uniref:hypothetical protein n=1 Tax=Sphingomonas sp. NFX23 TaxID=2819532 RepID=UPI003CF38EAE